MFWAQSLQEGKPVKSQTIFSETDFPVLHLSSVALPRNHDSSKKAYLLASIGKEVKDLVLACL